MYIVHMYTQSIMHRQDNFMMRKIGLGTFCMFVVCCLLIPRRIFSFSSSTLRDRGEERARVGLLLTSYRVMIMMMEEVKEDEEGLMQSPLFVLTCTLLRVPACTCTVRDPSF